MHEKKITNIRVSTAKQKMKFEPNYNKLFIFINKRSIRYYFNLI